MPHDSSPERPAPGHPASKPAPVSAAAFQPMLDVRGPSHEHWLQYLVNIRGAVAALRFNDGDLTERMRNGFDTSAEALDAVHAWAETERQLEAAIGLLRTAQARCTLAVSRVGAKFSAANAATDGQMPNATEPKGLI
ncbi:MAG TPA: hypothetical protein VLV76_22565 [Candidatus Acidoferrum sp.]|nr:hypothetical protein [Candidatus Acidoferrum sp.]